MRTVTGWHSSEESTTPFWAKAGRVQFVQAGLGMRVNRVGKCYGGSPFKLSVIQFIGAFVKPSSLKWLYPSEVGQLVLLLSPEELGRATRNGPSLLSGS